MATPAPSQAYARTGGSTRGRHTRIILIEGESSPLLKGTTATLSSRLVLISSVEKTATNGKTRGARKAKRRGACAMNAVPDAAARKTEYRYRYGFSSRSIENFR